jgi:hypothetical protein
MAWYHPHDAGSGYVASSLKLYRFLNLDSGIIKIVPDFDVGHSHQGQRGRLFCVAWLFQHILRFRRSNDQASYTVHPSPVLLGLIKQSISRGFPLDISKFSCIPMRFHFFDVANTTTSLFIFIVAFFVCCRPVKHHSV